MLRIFQSSGPLSFFLLLLYACILNIAGFLHPQPIDLSHVNVLSQLVFINGLGIEKLDPKWITCISFLCVFIQSVLISLLMQRFKIITKSSLVPSAVYLLIAALFPQFSTLFPELIVNFLLVWMLFKLFGLFNKTSCDEDIFDIGLLNGFSFLLFFPAAVFSFFSMNAMPRMRSFSFRELFVFLSGVGIVLLLAATVFFLKGQLHTFLNGEFYLPDLHALKSIDLNVVDIVRLSFWIVALIIAFFHLSARFSSNLIQIRKYLSTVVFLLIFSIVCLLLNKSIFIPNLFPLLIPTSILISYYLVNAKNRVAAESVFITLLAAVLLLQYSNFAS